MFSNILDMSCYNAFVLYCDIFPEYNKRKSNKRLLFLTELGLELSRNYREEKMFSGISRNVQNVSEKPMRRSRCNVCPRTIDRKTSTKCNECKNFICSKHSIIKCINCNEK